MIAARQIAFGKAAGAKKPYDAEIEYLESTGTQYIDTGVVGDDTVTFKASIYRSTLSANECAIGSFGGGLTRCWLSYFFGNKYYLGLGGTTDSPTSAPSNSWVTEELKIEDGKAHLYADGVDVATVYKTTFTSGHTIYIGAMNNSGSPNYWFEGRIGEVKLYQNSTLVRDFIPVRVGNIGYMYDRVSGQLFGNAGTGEFVLGKDVGDDVDYTAKDYIQDGLVFMQDCIENAGWGVHKSGAQTEWTELVSGEKAACDVTFTDTYATANANQTIRHTLALENLKSIEETKAVTYEVIMDNVGTIPSTYLTVLNIADRVCRLSCRGGNYPYQYWQIQGLLGVTNNAVTVVPQEGDLYLIRLSTSASHDLGVAKCYQNGIFHAERAMTFSDAISCDSITQKIVQGARMRAVRIYNRALTADEIAYNYNIDKARFGL